MLARSLGRAGEAARAVELIDELLENAVLGEKVAKRLVTLRAKLVAA